MNRSKQETQFLSFSTPINKQIDHLNKSPSSHNESFLSTKSSLKAAASSSSTTSSLANNFNKQVKFLIDFSGSTTRSTSTDDHHNRRALLFTSPVATTSCDNSGSNSNYNETPVQFSRASSLQSLNSCSIKNSPVLSSFQSEHSVSRQESGAQSPAQNIEQLSFLTCDSNVKSNEITVIEKTLLLQTVASETTVSYDVENSPWECNSRNSNISNLSIIREDNTPINADLDAIYRLLNKKKNQETPPKKILLFTPPVKLSNNHRIDSPVSPAFSELSIPSIINEDLKNEANFDFTLLNSRLFPPSKDDESTKPSEDEVATDDDNKILMDFVNKMLPNLKKSVENEEKLKVKKVSGQSRVKSYKNGPVVNMTKTAQLRMSKIQSLKSSSKNENSSTTTFKIPTAPKSGKNSLKRI